MSIVLVGSTSGSITLQEPAVAGTTVLDLPAVSGTILTTTSPKAGNVIQVVQGTTTTSVTSSTTTYADTGLTATITPTSSSSTILVLISHTNNYKTAGSSGNALFLNLCRNGSQIIQFASELSYTATTSGNYFASCFNYQDSPATTSATTYKTQFKNAIAASNVGVQANGNMSTITLLEIAG